MNSIKTPAEKALLSYIEKSRRTINNLIIGTRNCPEFQHEVFFEADELAVYCLTVCNSRMAVSKFPS